MKISLAGVNTSFSAIPVNKYLCVIESTEMKKSVKGDPYVQTTSVVMEDIDGSNEYSGRKLRKNFSLTTESLWAFKAACQCLGVDEEILNDEDGFDVEELIATWVGERWILDVDIKTYNDKEINDVVGVFPDTL